MGGARLARSAKGAGRRVRGAGRRAWGARRRAWGKKRKAQGVGHRAQGVPRIESVRASVVARLTPGRYAWRTPSQDSYALPIRNPRLLARCPALSKLIIRATAAFPKLETYGLADQTRRA